MGFISRLLAPTNTEIITSADLEAFLRGSRKTHAGVDVSVSNAQDVSSWFAGSRNIAEDIAKLPFQVYEAGDERRRATSSPFYRLVHTRWSTRWTSQQGREYMTFWAQQDGDAYALKNLAAGEVRELIPFRRGEVQSEVTDDGEFVYHVTINGRRETLTRRHVLHLEGFAMRTDGGAEMFKMSREDIALSLATERHGSTFFGNGANPGGGLSYPGALSDKAYERLKVSLQEDYAGSNAHSPLLLEEGAKWEQFGMSNDDSQFLETRQFQVTEHARRLRLPPHKVGDNTHATFSNIEHQTIEYVVDTLLPWALRWESAINLQVIQTNRVYAELLFDMLLRGDSKTRADVWSLYMQNGVMTRNEIRRRENLPPVEGGDEIYSQLHLATETERGLAQTRTRSVAANQLVRGGWHPDDVLEVVGLPPMRYIGIDDNGRTGEDSEPIDPDPERAAEAMPS